MPAFDVDDTIAAIASPSGEGVRGIVRISGPETVRCVASCFHADEDGISISEVKSVSVIAGRIELEPGIAVEGKLLLWPNTKSYTRQPTAEFHTVGATPILQMVLKSVCESGSRLAKPGEFTLRAFLSGRIDLTQAEAVLAVIDSAGEQQFETALQQLSGGLAGPLGKIRDQLLSTLAELEAGLDFVEEDIQFISEKEITRQLVEVNGQLESISNQISNRDLVARSAKVVLLGLPNSGKSSLFNALTGSGQAIVTDVEGTTTDFVSSSLSVDAGLVELIDTAGFEQPATVADGPIASQAQTHRQQQQQQAVVRLFCVDSSRDLTPWELDQIRQSGGATIVVLTKTDLNDQEILSGSQSDREVQLIAQIKSTHFVGPVVSTSSVGRAGIQTLREQISIAIADSPKAGYSVVGTTILRAGESLVSSQQSVKHALNATQRQLGEEIVAAEIRQALEGLGQVVGMVYTDDILDLVFGRFCIGK